MLGFRLFVSFRLDHLNDEKSRSKAFKKKLAYFKQVEQEKHLSTLIIGSILISFCIPTFFLSLLQFQATFRNTVEASHRIQKETMAIKRGITILQSSEPSDKRDSMSGRISEPSDQSKKEEIFSGNAPDVSTIETKIAEKVRQYFIVSHLMVSINKAVNTVTISFTDQNEQLKTGETLQKAEEQLISSFEELSSLKQVYLRLTIRFNEENTLVYTAHFNREKVSDSFKKVNDFERYVKLGGEKG